jgi:hypothetical protein
METEIAVHECLQSRHMPALLAVVEEYAHTHLVFEYGGVPIAEYVGSDGTKACIEENLEVVMKAGAALFEVLQICEAKVRLGMDGQGEDRGKYSTRVLRCSGGAEGFLEDGWQLPGGRGHAHPAPRRGHMPRENDLCECGTTPPPKRGRCSSKRCGT